MGTVGVAHGCGGSDFVEGRHDRHLVGDTEAVTDSAVTPDGTGGWLVTGYRQTKEFLRDNRFSRAAQSGSRHSRGPALRMSITEMDAPRHTQVRTLIGGAFSARRVEALRPRIEELADRLLGDLIAAGPTADLIAGFFAPFSFGTHCELLGVPAAHRQEIHQLSLDRLGAPGADPADTYHAELRLHAEVTAMLADQDGLPPGLLADLVAAHRAQGVITGTELTGLASSLFFDGYALAAAQLANTTLCLLTRPGLFASLRHDPDSLDGVIEESLRFSPSVTLSMARIARTDVDLDDATIRAGDRVTAAIPLANRDDTAFTQPRSFDPARTANRHLSFGHGTHHCLGAHLTRVEMRAALAAMVRQAPSLRLAVPEEQLTWYASTTIRSLTALPVRWSPCRQAQPPMRPAVNRTVASNS